jgi:hypothetical protein
LLLEHHPPYEPLGVKLEDLRNFEGQILQLDVDDLLVDSDEEIDQLLVLHEECDDGPESAEVCLILSNVRTNVSLDELADLILAIALCEAFLGCRIYQCG